MNSAERAETKARPVVLESFNLHKSYVISGRTLDILKGIDFKITEGETVSIVGPSGAGKSTLLHILGGLDSPNKGTVLFDKEDMYGLTDTQRAKLRNIHIGFVFQFYHLLPEFNALENVLLPKMITGNLSKTKSVENLGKALLEKVGLAERMDHLPSELSGGEQQRVAIARALINQPKIILCDEPTGNLDSQSGAEIIKLLMALNQENNQTIIMVTHDEAIACKTHRTIQIRDGQIV